MDALNAFAQRSENTDIALCDLGYPCEGDLSLQLLVETSLGTQPKTLANVPTSHEAWCRSELPELEWPTLWRIEDGSGFVVGEGNEMILGPDVRVYAPRVNLVVAGVQSGDLLYLPEVREEPWIIGGVVPIELRWHPNAGDTWHAIAPGGGDLVYNTACELIFGGVCPHGRLLRGDPNLQLPRRP
jgi:hypothetical protein